MVASLLAEAAATGAPDAGLFAGLPFERSHIDRRDARMDWPHFVRLLDNLRQRCSDDKLVALGESLLLRADVRSLLSMSRLISDVRQLYHWQCSDDAPDALLITCVTRSCQNSGPHSLRVVLQMAPGFAGSAAFFLIACGMFQATPRLIGLPAAHATRQLEANRAAFDILLPRTVLWQRLKHALREGRSGPRAVLRELRQLQTDLVRHQRELQAARNELDQRANLLLAANRISQVVHGEMNLQRTLDTIAEALVDVAGFAGAEIEVSATCEGRAVLGSAVRGRNDAQGAPTHMPIRVRGDAVGNLSVWPRDDDSSPVAQTTEWLVPTIVMAVDDALTFATLMDYRAQLEQRVAQRTAELQQAKDSLGTLVQNLQQAQAARDRIFANINHEIRTPLALMMLATGNLKEHIKVVNPDIENIETSARRLLDLVDTLLLLAAGQEGKLTLRAVHSDLAIFLKQSVTLWEAAARDAGLSLVYEGPSRCAAELDENAFERMMGNLISNAIKFTPSGGHIVVFLGASEDHMVVQVRDTGVGIDPDFRRRIFGRFEQGRPAVRGGMRGSGIGLSLVKELIEAHGGRVSVAANPGGGTVFELALPRTAPRREHEQGTSVQPSAWGAWAAGSLQLAPAPRLMPNIVAPPKPAEATVLVAEDDLALSDSITRLLANTYRVIQAADGMSALEMARAHSPDLLISDVQMPRLDGIELSRRFRELPGNRLAPVLLLTAHSSLASRLAGFEAGAVDYVLKPFEPAELLARVRSQLALRNLALRLSETEKLASLGVLSAGLAHELRNPANAVVNAIEPLCEMLPPGALEPGTATAELLGVIRDGAMQLRALAQQLLGFTRPGQLMMRDERLEVLVARALAMVSNVLRGIEVRKDLQYDGPVPCAGPLLVQVLTNLLENAAHAAGREGWVALHSRLIDGKVQVDIADSGPGIDPGLRERIFEPFFTTKPPGLGTGLGLSTARTILERHHGSLLLVDGLAGATFRLELPLLPPGPAKPPSDTRRAVP